MCIPVPAELLSGIETVLASPQGGACEEICRVLLTKAGHVAAEAASRRSTLDQNATVPGGPANGSPVCPALVGCLALDSVSSRIAVLLFFLKLRYVLGGMARFIAAACRVPAGQPPVFLPSAPTTREDVLLDHGRQQEAYEVALAESLGSLRCILAEERMLSAELPSFVSTRSDDIEETDVIVDAIAICTPPNMVWEKESTKMSSEQPWARILPPNLRTYALEFGRPRGRVDPCLLSEAQVPADAIGAQRAIRTAVLRTAALLQASVEIPGCSARGQNWVPTAIRRVHRRVVLGGKYLPVRRCLGQQDSL